MYVVQFAIQNLDILLDTIIIIDQSMISRRNLMKRSRRDGSRIYSSRSVDPVIEL